MHVMRAKRALILSLVGLSLSSALALAEPPSPAEALVVSTRALVVQSGTVQSLVEKYEASARSRVTLELRAGALRKELAAASDLKRRGLIEQQLATTNREIVSLYEMILAYQRMLAKEAREARRLAQETAKLARTTKAAGTRAQNERVRLEIQEANDKAEAAMKAAEAQLSLGVVAGALQVAGSQSGDAGARR
jgi:hypothetical protein